MKLLVHVGLHRAGSTSLQTWLNGAAPRLAEADCFVATAQQAGGEGSVFNLLTGQTFATAGADAVAAVIDDELRQRTASFSCGILSDENLLGAMPKLGVPAFSAAARLAKAFRLLSAHHEIVPVIVLREHVAWMTSLYRVAQFRCETAPFADFTKGLLAGDMPFATVLQTLSDAVSPAVPIVTSLEAIARDGGQAFLGRLGDALGQPPQPSPQMPRVNAAQNAFFCELRQKVARRGGFLVFEGNRDLTREANRLWHRHAERTTESLRHLGDSIRDHTVRVPERQRFHDRLAQAQKLLEGRPEGERWLPIDKALEALHVAMRAAHQPLLPPAEAARLRAVYAADRQWIALHHPHASLDAKDTP